MYTSGQDASLFPWFCNHSSHRALSPVNTRHICGGWSGEWRSPNAWKEVHSVWREVKIQQKNRSGSMCFQGYICASFYSFKTELVGFIARSVAQPCCCLHALKHGRKSSRTTTTSTERCKTTKTFVCRHQRAGDSAEVANRLPGPNTRQLKILERAKS